MLFECQLYIYHTIPPPHTIEEDEQSPWAISFVSIEQVHHEDLDKYFVCVKSPMPMVDTKYFDIAKLKNIYYLPINRKNKIYLDFKKPKRVLSILFQSQFSFDMFYHELKDTIKIVENNKPRPLKAVFSENYVTNCFDPKSLEFVNVKDFENRILDTKFLRKLVLENCSLPKMPVGIGDLTIKYFSISGSKLANSEYDKNTFWNWTSLNTICETLKTLNIDSVGLKSLPFEIMFLKNLRTLSAANNKLTYLPNFIGELKKLQYLFVADNMISYYPSSLMFAGLEEVDISNNIFKLTEPRCLDHILSCIDVFRRKRPDDDLIVRPLSHLSLFSLINNCVPFKRQDIPRSLWLLFDVVGRCLKCEKCILPDYSSIGYFDSIPEAVILTKDNVPPLIPNQFLVCKSKCRGRIINLNI